MPRSPAKQVWLEFHKESHHFSCAHFTIFSATERENLHGHNYFVRARAQTSIADTGLCFDYNELKQMIEDICDSLDETTLVPALSPYLSIRHESDYVCVAFADETMKFLPRDVKELDIRNVSVEELANWFITKLTSTTKFQSLSIVRFELSVSSGPSESATATWTP
ncbi:MAG: 6-carboxytetrahydropterin synthase [Gammaproteobacteria bacterium]|nr:6-carboxytetrahydropterin synthase [Gammaproteobacteria bacterium]